MTSKFKIYVNNIVEYENKGTYGVEFDMNRINKNLYVIFNPKDADDLKNTAKQHNDGISYMHRFCQFIVYLVLSNDLSNGNLALFDCRDDMDTALDIHLHLTKNGFDNLVKEDFMKQFLEIREIYEQVKNMAELTTEEL